MAEERRGEPASKSPRDKPTGSKFHSRKRVRSMRRKPKRGNGRGR